MKATKRLAAADWDQIRRFSEAMVAVDFGGVDVVVPASSLAELFAELDALKKEVSQRSKRHNGSEEGSV